MQNKTQSTLEEGRKAKRMQLLEICAGVSCKRERSKPSNLLPRAASIRQTGETEERRGGKGEEETDTVCV